MTTTFNFKPVFIGLLITTLVIYLFSSNTMSSVKIKSSSFSKTETIKLIYRGVPFGHKGYHDASDGIAKPFGGHSIPEQHRDGNNNSVFTSWTTDFMVAYRYATNDLYGRCSGILLIKKVDLSDARFVSSEMMQGGDIFNEKEILVKGMLNGAIPILVKPGMDNNLILNIIKKGI